MARRGKPSRIQSGIGTVATPVSSTGGQLTHVGKVRPLSAASVSADRNPLTVQRQSFTNPLKRQRFS